MVKPLKTHYGRIGNTGECGASIVASTAWPDECCLEVGGEFDRRPRVRLIV
jgi:hypothetical protein